MKFLRYFTIVAMAVVATVSVSCKKDKDITETKEYLNGTLSIKVPAYLQKGDVVHIVPTGVYKENEADTLLACSWYNPLTLVTDTLRLEGDPATKSKEFDFVVDADTLSTFTLLVYVWADGYYTKSANASFTIVNPELGTGSLKGYDFLSSMSSFTDSRDGLTYYYHNIGGKDWMIQNLGWNGSGKSYGDSDAMDPIFGRYYTWDEASAACPSGWHLPSNADFKALAASVSVPENNAAGSLMVDATFNGSKMWEFWPAVKINNATRFSAIPVGYMVEDGHSTSFKGMNNYAMFWTSDNSGDMAVARYIYVDKPVLYEGEFGKGSMRASVRCVR